MAPAPESAAVAMSDQPMQIDPCFLCGEPALDRYAVLRADLPTMTEQCLAVPLCEPHRRSLIAAGARGAADGFGAIWRLADAGVDG